MRQTENRKQKREKRKEDIVLIQNLRQDFIYKLDAGERRTIVMFLCEKGYQNGKIKIIIKGNRSAIKLLGIIIGSGQQKIELSTLQHHLQPESKSYFYIKSILFNQAKFDYRGLIRIEKGAQKSDAYLKSQNLLMSPSVEVENRPFLEISANDVKCTHGVTIGKIDQQQLYYLTTRGLTNKEATKLLLLGFFQDVIQEIPQETLQIECKKKISDIISKLLERTNN
ncbi:hypothetical protein FJY90_00120 [Candidatus Gottesmanbacteria bacterium]|nr:hypothetical protein [Candidatus Gottesmanbacteria bacterium]